MIQEVASEICSQSQLLWKAFVVRDKESITLTKKIFCTLYSKRNGQKGRSNGPKLSVIQEETVQITSPHIRR